MVRAIIGWIGIVLAGVSYLQAGLQSLELGSPSTHRAAVNRYCVSCHNEKIRTAGLMLDEMDVDNVSVEAAVWEKVVRKLRTGAMPPAGAPRPDKSTYDSIATFLETELDRAAKTNSNPGRPAVRRLNRAEYANVIRDLLAVNIDPASLLPADESGYGFDNIGDVLSVSPMLLERYMSAARKITGLAIGDRAAPLDFVTYEQAKLLLQDDRMSEDLPLGSRGGMAIRHHFPVDGDYGIRIRLQRNVRETVIGLGEAHDLDVRVDGTRIKLFTVGGEHESTLASRTREEGEPDLADAGLEIRFHAKAGPRLLAVTFLNENIVPEGVLRPRMAGYTFIQDDEPYNNVPGVGSITISGPYETKGLGETQSRRKIFVCNPVGSQDEELCASQILSTLARRAYRRPLGEGDVGVLKRFYDAGRSKGGFEAGIALALRRILVDPEFLFRVEQDPIDVPENIAYRIGDLELASRLSFFLWSSIPDDELLELAERGRLKDSEILEQQVRRMLADPRSKSLVSNFAGQWLYLRNMRSVLPDPDTFPEFDENLREALQRESELIFESMLREDRSIIELLNSDYTFLNERLARHYGIADIYGSRFRRVPLSNEARKGLLGQGSILTVTSYATRTSPVLRGKWVLENILGTPPPPPPANVPSLKEKTEDGLALTIRERLEMHRANPVCASCHAQMDPLGFALENFDAVGKWRIADENTPINATGVLPDGTRIQGAVELRKVLLNRHEEFATTVIEKLLTYALGRGVEYFDAPSVRNIKREAASSDYRWSSLIVGIVKSTPFQMRRSRE